MVVELDRRVKSGSPRQRGARHHVAGLLRWLHASRRLVNAPGVRVAGVFSCRSRRVVYTDSAERDANSYQSAGELSANLTSDVPLIRQTVSLALSRASRSLSIAKAGFYAELSQGPSQQRGSANFTPRRELSYSRYDRMDRYDGRRVIRMFVMSLRQLLLRMMLWSLALSAAAGVCTVLLAAHDVIGRVGGTGLAAAIASALLLASSRLVDREPTRPAGLLAMAVVIAEFLLALILIWGFLPWRTSFVDEERFALTAAAVALAGLPAVFFLYVAGRAGGGPAGWAAVALSIVCFADMLAGTWWPAWGLVRENWWTTAGIVGGCGILAVAALGGAPLSRRPWRWLGVAAAAAAAAMAITGVWLGLHKGGEALACVTSLAAVLGYWNLVLLVPLTVSQRWVRFVAMTAALVAAALVDVLVVTHQEFSGQAMERAAGAAGIVAACAGLALVVLARINRRIQPVAAVDLIELVVICPQCRKQQTIPVGGAVCGGCGLRIEVRLTEPCCGNCGYLLYGLKSGRCPECGSPISHPAAVEPARLPGDGEAA